MAKGKAQRKYLSEFAVSLYSARHLLLWANQILSGGTMSDKEAAIAATCHIYLICKRPATWFEPLTFKYKNNTLSGNIAYRVEGKTLLEPFQMPFQLSDGATQARLDKYPFRQVVTYTDAGDGVRYLPSNAVSFGLRPAIFRELEVLYVGQAFGDGGRSALDRLRSHSTLQKILGDVQYNNPDDEVVLLTFEYAPYAIITMIDGANKTAIRDESDHARFMSILDSPLSKHQQICLAEAGLIRYFAPEYNEIYKSSFPAKDQKILGSCRDLDFSGLIVEIDSAEIGVSLFSGAAKS